VATKKKAPKVVKKHPLPLKNVMATDQTIYILEDGTPFQDPVVLDPNGAKHPPKIYWQAIDRTTHYQIVLLDPPRPFKNPPDQILTDVNGQTPILTTDKNYANGEYFYKIVEVGLKGEVHLLSAGGIIIDA
jgi:hypothetical protein